LAFTKITDTGLNEVAKLTQLKYLYLSNNQLADVTGLSEITRKTSIAGTYMYANEAGRVVWLACLA
jgi:hypothetical protein